MSDVRSSVCQNKTNFKRKQCLLLARLWVWPSESLMTPVLYFLFFLRIISKVLYYREDSIKKQQGGGGGQSKLRWIKLMQTRQRNGTLNSKFIIQSHLNLVTMKRNDSKYTQAFNIFLWLFLLLWVNAPTPPYSKYFSAKILQYNLLQRKNFPCNAIDTMYLVELNFFLRLQQNTIQVSSMIHSARPTVSPVAYIVFA